MHGLPPPAMPELRHKPQPVNVLNEPRQNNCHGPVALSLLVQRGLVPQLVDAPPPPMLLLVLQLRNGPKQLVVVKLLRLDRGNMPQQVLLKRLIVRA